MSIFCSLLQVAHELEPHLPATTNYSSYSFDMYEKTREKQTKDRVILMLYNFIVSLYLKTKHYTVSEKDLSHIKFVELNNIQINNLISSNDKNIFFDTFCKAQKHYFALLKFSNICKMKLTPIKIKTDLLLNDIDTTKKNVFHFLQNNVKYSFVINDLINIITASLSNCSYFFAEPLPVKNPYNNMLLNNATLYNLYYYMKSNLFQIPILFELYFRSNFDMTLFKLHHEGYIREIFIKNFVTRSNHVTLYPYVIDMFDEYKPYLNKIFIHKNFPREELVKIMRPYLELHLFSKYLISGSERKYKAENLLKRKLYKFSSCNPEFGRRVVKFIPIDSNKKRLKQTIQYNKECVSFYDNSQELFRVNWRKYNVLHYRFRALDIESEYDDDDDDSFDP
jgi:hypothetical protein